jgi:hypothetical protein
LEHLDQRAAGVALLLWAADPEAPHLLAAPFLHAASAAAMDVPVEIYFTARSVRLLVPGVAQTLRVGEMSDKTLLDAMREALEQGARLLVCTDALVANGIDRHGLIPECSGFGGAVQFMARALDLRWRALVF